MAIADGIKMKNIFDFQRCYFIEVVLLVLCCEKSLQTSFAELITPFGPKMSNYLKSAALLDVSSSENLSVMKPLNGRDRTKISGA